MKKIVLLLVLVINGHAALAEPARAVPNVAPTEVLDLSPPPVPEFMLHPPAKPLTQAQMQQQADEAAHKARAQKNKPLQPTPVSAVSIGK